MTTGQQILHIMRKDFLESRRGIAVFWFVVLIATAKATEWRPLQTGVLDYSMILVVLVGMLVVAMFVHADSPIRADAFWATRPFDPKAMLAAKVCLAVLVLMVPALIGEAIALHHFGVLGQAIPRALASSSWWFGGWLLAAMVVASLTKDLKTFALTLILTPLATLFIGALLPVPPLVIVPTAFVVDIVGLMGLASAIVLVLRQYAKRDERRRTLAIGILSAAAAVAWMVIGVAAHPPALAHGTSVSTPPLRMTPPSGGDLRRSTFTATLSVENPDDSTKFGVVDATLRLNLRDGTSIQLRPTSSGLIGAQNPVLPDNYEWLFKSGPVDMPILVFARLSDSQRARVAAGLSSIVLDGTAVVMRPMLIGSIPIATPGAARLNGVRVTLAKTTNLGGSPIFEVNITRVDGVDPQPGDGFSVARATEDFGIALLNDVTRRAIALRRTTSSAGSGWLVLPGARVQSESVMLEAARPVTGTEQRFEDEWMRQGHLVVYRWVPRYTVPIHIESSGAGGN